MANYVTRRTIRASLTYTINRLDSSSIQNIIFGVLASFIALATLVVAYLQYKRSASREHPAATVEQERSVTTSNDELPFDELRPRSAASDDSALPPATADP